MLRATLACTINQILIMTIIAPNNHKNNKISEKKNDYFVIFHTKGNVREYYWKVWGNSQIKCFYSFFS